MDNNIFIDEEKCEKETYDYILEISDAVDKLIGEIEKIGRDIDINERVPNIGVTLNNKVSEISRQFKNSNISMFVEDRNGFPVDSYIGNAILSELTLKAADAKEALSKYIFSVEKVAKSPIKKILHIIKRVGFGFNSTIANKNETQEINSYLAEYGQKNEEIYEYNLRDNIVETLVSKIISTREKYQRLGISDEDMLQRVEPTLKALGLENLIPQLRENLEREEKHSDSSENRRSWELSNWEINPEEFRKVTSQITQNTVAKEVKKIEKDEPTIDT